MATTMQMVKGQTSYSTACYIHGVKVVQFPVEVSICDFLNSPALGKANFALCIVYDKAT